MSPRLARRVISRRSAARSTSSRTPRKSSRESSQARSPSYDAVTGLRERKLDLYSCTVAGGEGVLWSMGFFGDKRLSTGPGELRIIGSVTLPYRRPASVETTRINQRDLAVGYGSVWALGDGIDRRMWRLDRRSGRILATIELPFIPRTVAAGEGGVWVTAPLDDRVFQIDPETNAITATIPHGPRHERRRHRSRFGVGDEHDRRHGVTHRPGHRRGRRPDRGRRPATRGRGWRGRRVGDRR